MKSKYFPASERGVKNQGWLRSNFFFAFSDFADPTKSAFGTLVAFNDDFVESGKGFGIHPHVNMEIISVLLKGKMSHKDTMGYDTSLGEDGVQIMSAGSGLRHEEYNVGTGEVNFLQIWIQPKLQNITPRYQQRHFPAEKRKNQLVTIVSNEEGLAHCWINQNSKLSLGYFDQGLSVDYSVNPTNKCLFIFVIEGEILVNESMVHQRDAIGIWDTAMARITAKSEARYLVIETPVNQK
jgi:redox-sensitive bicupin YhaK (pirin superfamily)